MSQRSHSVFASGKIKNIFSFFPPFYSLSPLFFFLSLGSLFDHEGNYEMRFSDFRGIEPLNVPSPSPPPLSSPVFIRRISKTVTQFAVSINVIRPDINDASLCIRDDYPRIINRNAKIITDEARRIGARKPRRVGGNKINNLYERTKRTFRTFINSNERKRRSKNSIDR